MPLVVHFTACLTACHIALPPNRYLLQTYIIIEKTMDLTKGKISSIYFKYLAAAFGSCMISSIYGMVDTAMVGHYHGPEGSAAMAIVAPIWNIVYSLGLLTGIGGSVLLGTERGKKTGRENQYFTVAFFGTLIISVICWIVMLLFDEQLLIFFGADSEILPYAMQYTTAVKYGVPLFLFSQALSAFLRNDGDPQRGTVAVICSGIFNVAADYIFIFVLDMGAFGAGLGTTLGAVINVGVMATHFLSKKNTLRFVKPVQIMKKFRQTVVTGFPSFFVDVAMGILTIFFNRQIARYLGNDALAVYGIIANVSTLIQCCAYSVGQSAQPLFSVNLGAGHYDRVKKVCRYGLYAAAVFGVFWTVLLTAIPNGIIRLFMNATDSVLTIAPTIIRYYAISFLLLPFNIFSTYYFQSLLKPFTSFAVSVARGMVVSGILIYVLPLILPTASIWFAMPITELIVAIAAIILMVKYTRELGQPTKNPPVM